MASTQIFEKKLEEKTKKNNATDPGNMKNYRRENTLGPFPDESRSYSKCS